MSAGCTYVEPINRLDILQGVLFSHTQRVLLALLLPTWATSPCCCHYFNGSDNNKAIIPGFLIVPLSADGDRHHQSTLPATASYVDLEMDPLVDPNKMKDNSAGKLFTDRHLWPKAQIYLS